MISIVIAAYNAAPFIGICINSCLESDGSRSGDYCYK